MKAFLVKAGDKWGEKLLDPLLSSRVAIQQGSTRERTNRTGRSHIVAQMEADPCFLLVCFPSIFLCHSLCLFLGAKLEAFVIEELTQAKHLQHSSTTGFIAGDQGRITVLL